MLHLMQFILRFQKTARHRVLQEGVAVFLKIGNFLAVQRLSGMLLFVQRLSLGIHQFVLPTRRGIGHESVNPAANRGHFRLGDNRCAKFLGLFFNLAGHKIFQTLIQFRRKIN